MDALSPLDAAFLHIETDRSQMHVGSVTIFEGPAPSYDDYVGAIERVLHLVPRYRQKVRFVPLGLGPPVWVDDPHFNIGYHLRHTALPPPGGTQELRNLTGRVMSQLLDRTKPLWEIWFVEGFADGRWATISKVHHCLVDGVAGVDLLAVILTAARDPSVVDKPVPKWQPEPEPSGSALAAYGLSRQPAQLARALASGARHPARLARNALTTVRGLAAYTPLLRLHGSSLTAPVGPHRSFTWTARPLADAKKVKDALGGTVNDVVLSVVAHGFREMLLASGDPVEGRSVRSMVPVSMRAPDEHGVFNNRVSAIFVDLPVGIEDPEERFEVVRSQMDHLKGTGQAVAAQALIGLGNFAPVLLLHLGGRAAMHAPAAVFETVTTNMPGPQFPLYALGREMVEAYPYVPIAQRVRISTGIWSYNGMLTFGISGDWDAALDLDMLAKGIDAGFTELLAAAEKK
ncbi:MAG: WS/DGAT/MGAT family O-acyltransferase [Actinomycetota bacterium]